MKHMKNMKILFTKIEFGVFFGSYEFHLDGKMTFGRFYDFDLKSSKIFQNVEILKSRMSKLNQNEALGHFCCFLIYNFVIWKNTDLGKQNLEQQNIPPRINHFSEWIPPPPTPLPSPKPTKLTHWLCLMLYNNMFLVSL